MLINCPECGQIVSDKVCQCIHCGYSFQNKDMIPNRENNLCVYNGVQYDLTQYIDFFNTTADQNGKYIPKDLLKAREIIENIMPLNASAVYDLIGFVQVNKCVPTILIPLLPSTPQPTQQSSQPHCPKCNSTNIQIVPRKWSLFAGFMTNKTDRVCVNCKHRW